ncbi:MAG: diacylglycerol kinase family lipid kinase [Paludibacteraceae bacterium]
MLENTQNHWIVITNPKAGKRKLPAQRKLILEELDKANIPYTFVETKYSGHAIEIARDYANKGFENFLVLGGDGSISEVVNGVFSSDITDTSKIKIALIPRGTGNDWGRFWGIKKDDKKSVKIFLERHYKLIDVGKVSIFNDDNTVSYRYFINSVGYGLDAQVNHITHQLKKYVGSFSLLYTFALLIAVFRHKSTKTQLEINGEISEIKLFTMNIANGPYNGGGIKQNPDAVPYDGIFHMMVVEKPTFKDIITVLPSIFNGKLTQHKIINSCKTTKVSIKSNSKMMVEADGINIKNVHISKVDIIPKGIQMVVPK